MNKAQIKAELRRSACEDYIPWRGVNISAHKAAVKFLHEKEWDWRLWKDVTTEITFFLLVAEAL